MSIDQHVFFSIPASQHRCSCANQVTVRVIDLFEAVHINQHRKRALGPVGTTHLSFKRLLQGEIIRQIGQNVVGRQISDRFIRPALFAHITCDCGGTAEDPAEFVYDGRNGK